MKRPFTALALALCVGGASAEGADPPRYLRLVEEGDVIGLELAIRRFAPADGSGPHVFLAAAIHIAEPAYYAALQEKLDALPLVLFESVKPPGTGDPRHDVIELTDAHRVAITRGRIRFMASAMYRYRARKGNWPGDLAELEAGLSRDVATLARNARMDGWGRPLRLAAAPSRTKRPFDVQSLGADGRIGGKGPDSDLCFADQDELEAVERGEGGGIQQDLAEALGLVFQLEAMDHSGENWKNSDLSMDQVESRLLGSDVEADELFASLRGSSFLAKAAGFTLKLLTRFSYGSAALKIFGLEILGRADEILESSPVATDELFAVLIEDRNRVVVEDLRKVVGDGHRTVGVIYGAAHMRDLERALVEELGYEPVSEEWLRAVTVDTTELGIDPDDVRWMRRTVRTALDRQLGR